MTKSRVLIVSHNTSLNGPADYYCRYLVSKDFEVSRIIHPLDVYKRRDSKIIVDKRIIKKYRRKEIGLVNLIIDIFISVKYILKISPEVIVGANNFDVLPAIIVKKIFRKKVKMIIYFASDYSEKRFNSLFLDLFYKIIEKISLRYSDITISNTVRAEAKRLQFNLDKAKSLVIPNSVHLETPRFNEKNIDKTLFIYIGSVTREHGLFEIISVLASTIKHLTIIGQGEDLKRITDFCEDQSVNIKVHSGKDREFVIEYLQDFAGIGLAPYNLHSKWTYYCSPLKVNEYIACGVPVLISNVPEVAQYVKEKQLGMTYGEGDLEHAKLSKIIEDFSTENFYLKSEKFYSEFNDNNLFSKIPV